MTLTKALVALFVYLFALHPHNTPYNAPMAEKTAAAIAEVTTEMWEAETLARIVRWESGLRDDVANCTVLGPQGERGLWQVKPKNASEKTDLCSSDIVKQARIALKRVRESKEECERKGFRGADVLGVYTDGVCKRGNRRAAFRYGDGSKLRSLVEAEKDAPALQAGP
jgi:hypothetical protein